jgi:hypothetical protein
MSQSTPLDSLSSNDGPTPTSSTAMPPADEERVRRILAEMNADAVVQPAPGQVDSGRMITEPPVSMSTGQLRMDPGTARANVIGNSTPTMADFHAMLQQAPPGMAPFHSQQMQQQQQDQQQQQSHQQIKPAPISWKAAALNAFRGPLTVGIIVFLLNLPIVTSILSRYASWMYLSSGEISIGGLLVKALLAAALFAAYQGGSAILDR